MSRAAAGSRDTTHEPAALGAPFARHPEDVSNTVDINALVYLLQEGFVHLRCRHCVIVSPVPCPAWGAFVMVQKQGTGTITISLSDWACARRMAPWRQRLQGELWLMRGQHETTIVASGHDAITADRHLQPTSLERRIAVRLSRLW
jgi:hypothetical protein